MSEFARKPDAGGDIHNTLQPLPDSFDAGFAVTLSGHEAAEHRDQPNMNEHLHFRPGLILVLRPHRLNQRSKPGRLMPTAGEIEKETLFDGTPVVKAGFESAVL